MRLFATIPLLLVQACMAQSPIGADPLNEPGATATTIPIAFDYGVSRHGEARSGFVIASAASAIRIEGVLWTGQGGFTLNADGVVENSTVRIEVVATQTHAGITLATPHWYDAVLQNLSPGTYTVQLIHRKDGRSQGMLEERITVQ